MFRVSHFSQVDKRIGRQEIHKKDKKTLGLESQHTLARPKGQIELKQPLYQELIRDIFFVKISSQLKEIYDKWKQQSWHESLFLSLSLSLSLSLLNLTMPRNQQIFFSMQNSFS